VARETIIQLDTINHGEFLLAQVAVDEVPSVPFFAHKSIREKYPKEDDFLAYLFRMGKATIARCGDARNPLPTEIVEGSNS
jgi:hypothetical protein